MAIIKKSLLLFFLFFVFPVSVNAASFKISPNRGTFNQNCTSKVDIILNAENSNTNAADIIIDYDPSKIDILQVIPGTVYQNYFGNIVDTNVGVIRLTGASFVGSFNSSGTFATIQFKPKLNSGTATFNIRFTGANPYNTLDSNIADVNTSNDLLTSVDNGFFSFSSGSCVNDTTPPVITFVTPTDNQQSVPATANLLVDVSDTLSGVDINTVELVINGFTYHPSDSQITTTGNSSLYHFTLNPTDPIFTTQTNTFMVKASDLSGNSKTSSISFNSPIYLQPTCPVYSTPTPTTTLNPTPTTDPFMGQIIPFPTQSIAQTTSPDNNSPQIEFIYPKTNTVTSTNPVIQFRVSDTGTGIDINTLKVTLNNHLYNPKITGTTTSYLATLTLPDSLTPDTDYQLTVFVSDFALNAVSQSVFFHTNASLISQIIQIFHPSTTSVSYQNPNRQPPNFLIPLLITIIVSLLIYYFYCLLKKINQSQLRPYGIVFDQFTNEPICGVKVTALNDNSKIIATTKTNIFGIFAFNLPSGHYRFIPSHPQYSFDTYPNHPTYLEIGLKPTTKTIKLSGYGTVIDAQGKIQKKLTLELWQNKINRPVYVRHTDSLGQYRFRVPHGHYTLRLIGSDKILATIDTRHLVGGYTTVNQDLKI